MTAPQENDQNRGDAVTGRIERLLCGEPFTKALNIRLVASGEGRAVLEMDITEGLTNDKGICHGGALFTLADVAFGAAALQDGNVVVTVGSDMHFLRPGRCGGLVRATALLLSRTGRSGLFQVSLSDNTGRVIAAGMFKGQWLPADRLA